MQRQTKSGEPVLSWSPSVAVSRNLRRRIDALPEVAWTGVYKAAWKLQPNVARQVRSRNACTVQSLRAHGHVQGGGGRHGGAELIAMVSTPDEKGDTESLARLYSDHISNVAAGATVHASGAQRVIVQVPDPTQV